MKKRFASLLLVLVLLCTLLPQTAFFASAEVYSGTCGGEGDGSNLTWTLDVDSGKLTISGNGRMKEGIYSYPWQEYKDLIKTVIMKHGVTSIGSYAFSDYSALEKVEISDTVSRIGDFAFTSCSALVDVTIPEGVTTIGIEAFYNCTSLASIEIPDSVTWLGNYVFEKTAFYENAANWSGSVLYLDKWLLSGKNTAKSLVIRAGTVGIASYAFEYCDELASVSLPSSLKTIGGGAFFHSSLQSVVIPDSVETIGGGAFGETPFWFDQTNLSGGLLYSGKWLLGGNSGAAVGHVAIRPGTERIANSALSECLRIESVSIPNSVQYIGAGAFSECSALKSVTIPDGITRIEPGMFAGCTAMESVTLPDSVTSIGEGAFYNCTALESVTLPDGVTSIGEEAFYNCAALESITLPDGIKRIERATFEHCTALESVALPDGLASIEEGAFRHCTALKSVNLPDSLTSIGSYAFCDCTALMSVTIPSRMTRIGKYAFGYRYPTEDDGIWMLYKVDGFTICGYDGSPAQAYAAENGFPFVRLDGDQQTPTKNPFGDVSEDAYYFEPVMWAVQAGVTGGIDETHFGPNKPCTRAQVVTFLYAAAGKPALAGGGENETEIQVENPFVDVKESDWYYAPVLWAYSKGITGGVDATHFGPNKTCTRAQVVTFLYSWKGKPAYTATENPFDDVKTTAYYYDAVMWAVENGVTGGTGPRTFGPNKNCTRCQVVTFLYKAK